MNRHYRTCVSTPLRLKISPANRQAFGAESLIEEAAENHAAHSYTEEIKTRWSLTMPSPEYLAQMRRNYAAIGEKHPDLGELKLDMDTYAIFNRRFQG